MSPLLTIRAGFPPVGAFTDIWAPNLNNVEYHPTGGSANDYQSFNLYLPDSTLWPVPAAGYPCVVRVNLDDGYTGSSKETSVSTDTLAYAILEAGIAFCDATVTWTTAGGNVTGGGLFWDPTDANWGSDDSAEQDVIWIIQKLRDLDTEYTIDSASIGLYGANNAASTVALWVALEADHIDSGAATTQEQMSSVPDGCMVLDPTTWYPATASGTTQNHLRDEGTPSTVATLMSDASSAHKQAASPIDRAYTNGSPNVPCILRTSDTSPATDATSTAPSTGLPAASGTITDIDDGWHSYLFRDFMRHGIDSPLYHVQHSSVWSTETAQRDEVDRVVAATGDMLTSHVASFFRATLAGPQEAATWTTPYSWSFQVVSSRRGVRSEGAVVHRRQTRTGVSLARLTASTRTWRVGKPIISDAEATTLLALEAAVKGKSLRFNFPPPDAPGKISAHLISGSLDLVHRGAGQWSYQAEVQEAI